jgi:hypothetical protein
MSTETSIYNTGIPLTPTPTIVNGTPSNPATTMVVVPEAPIITIAYPIVNAQSLALNPFGSLGHSPSYNVQSIPVPSSPFSYGMLNFTSQFSKSIPVVGPNASIGLGGTTPPYTPFSFCGYQIPQTTLNMGGIPSFNSGSNPLDSGWRNQPRGNASAQVSSYTLTSSVLIPINMFGMTNPPLSSRFTPKGGWFHAFGNPQPGSNSTGGNFFNPHQNIPTGIMPNQPLMNHPGGGSKNLRHGHGAYHNPRWVAVPQSQYFQGSLGQMSQPRIPFMATLNLPKLSKLMNDLCVMILHGPPSPPSFLQTFQNTKVRMVRILVITLLPFSYGVLRIPIMTILFD